MDCTGGCTAVREYVSAHPDAFDLVIWVLFDEKTKAAYDQAVKM